MSLVEGINSEARIRVREALQPSWSEHMRYSLPSPRKSRAWGFQVPSERTVLRGDVCSHSHVFGPRWVESGQWVQKGTNQWATSCAHTLISSTHASHPRDGHLWQFEGATLKSDILKWPEEQMLELEGASHRGTGHLVDGVCGLGGISYRSEVTI